jgi:hypothetical protein
MSKMARLRVIGAPMMSFRPELVRFRFAKMCAWYNE